MLVQASERSWDWSAGAVAALGLATVQIILALVTMAHPALQTMPMFLLLIVLTVANAVLVAYASLPIEAKVATIAAIGTALIGTAMVHGALRERMAGAPSLTAVENDTALAPNGPAPREPKVAGLTITSDDAAAAGFGADVARYVAEGDGGVADPPAITATIALDDDAQGTVYRIIWSVRRGADRRWCGQSAIRYASRDAAARAFAGMIATARSIPATEGLRCD